MEEKTVAAAKKKVPFLDRIFVVLILAFVIIVAGQSLGGYVRMGIGALLNLVHPGTTGSDWWITGMNYLPFLGIWMVLIALIAIRPSDRPMLKSLWRGLKGNNLKMLLVGLGIGLGMNLFCAAVAMLNGDIAIYFDSFKPLPFFVLFVFVFIQSAAEEAICRAFIYQKMTKRGIKPMVAAIANAAFFSFIHIANPGVTPMALLNIFLYGILFSFMIIYMDSLWAAMAAHAAWNFCQNIILGLPNSGIVCPFSVFKLDAASATESFAYSVSFGIEGTIVACALMVVVMAIMVWGGRRKGIVPTNIWPAAPEKTGE